jgi:hypothetical protein
MPGSFFSSENNISVKIFFQTVETVLNHSAWKEHPVFSFLRIGEKQRTSQVEESHT